MRKAFIIVDIVLIFVLIGTWISIPEEIKLNLFISALAIILTGILIYPEKEIIYESMKNKFVKNVTNTLISSVLIFLIIGILNYLFFKNNKVWDLTNNKVNSLSKQSRLILDSLKNGVKITVFAKRNNWEQYLSLFQVYKNYKSNVSFEAIDIDLNPLKAKEYNITKEGEGVIEYNSQKVIAELISELNITNAILKISKSKKKIIYFTVGHNELNFNDHTNEGVSFLDGMIKNNFYDLLPLDLALRGTIPKTADAILILGPKNGFLDKEIKELSRYLENGGKLILAIDPVLGEEDKFGNLRTMLQDFGIMLRNDVIVDKLSTVKGADASILLIDKFNEESPITKDFKSRIILPITSSILKIDSEKYDVQPVAFSTLFPGSWAETDTYSLLKGRVIYSPEDLKGPVSMAVTSESKTNALDSMTKIFAIGTSRFLLNGYKNQSPNFNFFLNGLSWAIDEKAIISINRPGLTEEKIYMSDKQINLIWYLSILVMPLLMLILSIIIYRKRVKL